MVGSHHFLFAAVDVGEPEAVGVNHDEAAGHSLDAPRRRELARRAYRLLTAYSAAATKLLRAYAIQVEALRRLRGGGVQQVRVEHVHINDEARAVIGSIMVNQTCASAGQG